MMAKSSSPHTLAEGLPQGKTASQKMLNPIQLSSLKHISRHVADCEGVKVENLIGFTSVPLGLAGPLTIHGQHQRGTFFGPLATVEATVIASCSRGCKAFQNSISAGVHAIALSECMTRAPVFGFRTVSDAVAFYQAIPSLEPVLKASAEKTSRFAKLVRLVPHIIGTTVHVKFEYTCGNASGQNMSTIATHVACQELVTSDAISQTHRIISFQLDGNMSSDKKLSAGTVHSGGGRGVQVLAWSTLSNATCEEVLKVSSERLHTAISVINEGGVRNGHAGQNINTANILAAMFIACGQDAATVLESGWSHLTSEFDPRTKQLTLSLFFPSLLVGTVGGGTSLPSQREALNLIGCVNSDLQKNTKFALAETIAAFALALDVSTVSALANDTFTRSHQVLARKAKL